MLKFLYSGAGHVLGNASSKLGFFGATPVVKPAALTAELGGTLDTTFGQPELDELENVIVRVGEIEAALQGLGLLS